MTSTSYAATDLPKSINSLQEQLPDSLSNNLLNYLSLLESSVLILKLTFGKSHFRKQFFMVVSLTDFHVFFNQHVAFTM